MISASQFRYIGSHSLVPAFLTAESVVIDVGANVGEFSMAIVRGYDCRCYAIEPSPEIFARIPAAPKLRKFCFAASTRPGETELFVSAESTATSLHESQGGGPRTVVRVPTRTLEEFCGAEKIGAIDVLKMDVEGEELPILNAASDAFLGRIGQITVEFHEWIGLGSASEVKGVIVRLEGLGFTAFNLSRTNYSDVLFIHQRLISRFEATVAKVGIWTPRVIKGIGRRLFRAGSRSAS